MTADSFHTIRGLIQKIELSAHQIPAGFGFETASDRKWRQSRIDVRMSILADLYEIAIKARDAEDLSLLEWVETSLSKLNAELSETFTKY